MEHRGSLDIVFFFFFKNTKIVFQIILFCFLMHAVRPLIMLMMILLAMKMIMTMTLMIS